MSNAKEMKALDKRDKSLCQGATKWRPLSAEVAAATAATTAGGGGRRFVQSVRAPRPGSLFSPAAPTPTRRFLRLSPRALRAATVVVVAFFSLLLSKDALD